MTKKIVIFGATSAIAMATAKIWASRHAEIMLIARSLDKLQVVKQDLITRGAKSVEIEQADLSDISVHQELLNKIKNKFTDFDCVLIAYGTLGNQEECQMSFKQTQDELNTNFLSVVSLLTPLANDFAKKGSGTICVITSVAGDRGRQSNYVYGTAKGALSLFLQGLRNRLSKSNVAVIDIKPGFTDTPMTADMKKNFLFASPEKVGAGIVKAIDNKKDVVYLPWFWCFIMLIIKSIPEKIFKKLNL